MSMQSQSADDSIELLRDRVLDVVRSDGRDLNLRQLAVLLVCFTTDEPQTARGLVELLSIPKSSLTRTADRLEAADFIRRQADPADGRSVLIVITPAGKRYCKAFVGKSS